MTAQEVKRLRDETDVGMMEAKKALEIAKGDYDLARKTLQEEGMMIAEKRRVKPTRHSTIGYYMHAKQRIGVMVELFCESDLTATADFFSEFANEIAMHIASTGCQYLSREDIPTKIREQLYNDSLEQAKKIIKDGNKSEAMTEQIVNGMLDKFYRTYCLLEQRFYKDKELSIQDLIMKFIYTHKENVEVKRFTYYKASRLV